jgi:hypothetical protein
MAVGNCEFVLIIIFKEFCEAVSRSNGTFINRRLQDLHK